MYINKIVCPTCLGTGRAEEWKAIEEPDEKGYGGVLARSEIICPQCGGKGYTQYPDFPVEEAVKIAKHFGFDIYGLEVEDENRI